MPKNSCITCRHWKPPPGGEIGCSGICRGPSLSSGYAGWMQTEASDTCEDWTQMSFYTAQDGMIEIDRRGALRTSVEFPARLQTTGGNWSGQLSDFSETGARLRIAAPPKAGTQALLKCGSDEIFCKIAWASDDSCGLAFDRPIPRALVMQITGETGAAAAAAARPSKVFAAKRRAPAQHASLERTGPGLPEWEMDQHAPPANRPAPSLAHADAPTNAFESRDESGYIKFYPFRAMANP